MLRKSSSSDQESSDYPRKVFPPIVYALFRIQGILSNKREDRALWLAKSKYTDITVFDMQPLAKNSFNPTAGLDSASADINKIMRLSYGTEIDYQRLAYEAGRIWKTWNEQIESGSRGLPEVLEKDDKLWYSSGMLRMSATEDYGEFELRTLENMQKEGLRDMQYMCDNPEGTVSYHSKNRIDDARNRHGLIYI
jgi:hypothetical protein